MGPDNRHSLWEITIRVVLWVALLFPWIDFVLKHKLRIYPISSIWDDAFLMLVWLLVIFRLRKIKERRAMLIPFLTFVAIFFLSAAVNHVPLWVLQDNIRRTLIPFGVALLLASSETLQASELILPMLISTLPMAIMGIYQYIMKVPIPPQWVDSAVDTGISTRAFAIFVSPNILASFMERAEAILVGLMIGGDKRQRLLWAALLAVHLTCHVMTLSRASLAALILSLTLGLMLIDVKAGLLWIGGASIASALIPQIRKRFEGLFSKMYFYKSAMGGRLFQWNIALNHWEKHRLLGSGPGTFGSITAWNLGVGGGFRIDMMYFRILAEMGILGLVTFIWWMISILQTLLSKFFTLQGKTIQKYVIWGIAVGWTSLMLHGLANNHFEVIPHMVFTWALVGGAVGSSEKTEIFGS